MNSSFPLCVLVMFSGAMESFCPVMLTSGSPATWISSSTVLCTISGSRTSHRIACTCTMNENRRKNSDISRLPKPELQRNYVNVIICTSNLKSCFSIYLIPSLRRNLFCSSFQNINIPRNKHRKHLMSSKKLSYYTFLFKFLS